jgi:alpha-tubulin suppressor-like RCC1 family protein
VTEANLVYCWGLNEKGQLGNGGIGPRDRPVAVAGGRRFRHVSTGAFYSCAITLTDRVFCWGSNSQGQLGDGTTTDRLTPTPIAAF